MRPVMPVFDKRHASEVRYQLELILVVFNVNLFWQARACTIYENNNY